MPDSTGFGDYTESGQVIPVSFRGRKGGYTHCMFLNDEGPIAGGRELWGFPKKLAQPTLRHGDRHARRHAGLRSDSELRPARWATSTAQADLAQVQGLARGAEFSAQNHPARRRQPRICELVEYHLEELA